MEFYQIGVLFKILIITNNNLGDINNSNLQQSNHLFNNSYIITSVLFYRLKLNQHNTKMSYYYSNQNGVSFTYENKGINNNKDITVTEGQPDTGDEEKFYLFFTEKDNIQ